MLIRRAVAAMLGPRSSPAAGEPRWVAPEPGRTVTMAHPLTGNGSLKLRLTVEEDAFVRRERIRSGLKTLSAVVQEAIEEFLEGSGGLAAGLLLHPSPPRHLHRRYRLPGTLIERLADDSARHGFAVADIIRSALAVRRSGQGSRGT